MGSLHRHLTLSRQRLAMVLIGSYEIHNFLSSPSTRNHIECNAADGLGMRWSCTSVRTSAAGLLLQNRTCKWKVIKAVIGWPGGALDER